MLYERRERQDEKALLPSTAQLAAPPSRPAHTGISYLRILTAGLVLLGLLYTSTEGNRLQGGRSIDSLEAVCPQQEPWKPSADFNIKWPSNDTLADRLSGAVKIDTSVHDAEPAPEDDPELYQRRFQPFREYLATTFPSLYAEGSPVQLELVHEHGLLYTWKGKDDNLKPLLLMAHQDVVPVDPQTVDDWPHPPFSGAIANGSVWGRGSVDAKSWLISILSGLETLIDSRFEPERTILVSFGYDEEVNGKFGGQYLAAHIQEKHGNDSIALIVDEGNPILSEFDPQGFGLPVALPAVEEKGNVHISIRIDGPGGHSSGPPRRTTVGLLSEFVASIETNPHNLRPAVIPDGSVHLKTLQCLRDQMPAPIRKALKDLQWAETSSMSSLERFLQPILAVGGYEHDRRKRNRIELAKRSLLAVLPEQLALPFSTTQTPTVFHGGIKLNAIPPSASVEIDHRVALHQTIDYIKSWYLHHLTRFARTHDLAFRAFGEDVGVKTTSCHQSENDELSITASSDVRVTLDIVAPGLEPAPVTPLTGSAASPWRLFQSVVLSTWPSLALIAPSQMRGNTDTRCK